MSRLTREDEHRLNDYNRRVKEGGIEALSEDDQLWYSLLTDRYEKFLEVGMRVMHAAAAKEREEKSGGGGLFGFLSNVGSSSYSGSNKGGTTNNGNYRNSMALSSGSHTAQSQQSSTVVQGVVVGGGGGNVVAGAVVAGSSSNAASTNNTNALTSIEDEADLLGSPYPSLSSTSAVQQQQDATSNNTSTLDDKQFLASFGGHPPPPKPPAEFPSSHWSWVQENLVVGAIPFADTNSTKDMPGHIIELQDQCLRRYSKVSLVISCLEMDEEPPVGFCTLKDWDNVVGGGTTSFISVPLPSDPSQPIPKSTIQEVITACAQISALSHANMRHNGNNGGGSGFLGGSSNAASPVGARVGSGGPSPSCLSADDEHSSNITPGSFGNRDAAFNGDEQSSSSSPMPISNNSSAAVNTSSPSRFGGALRRLTQANPKAPDRKRVAYVHCKAGTQRAYVVAACYLMSQHAKTFAEVDRYLRLTRPSFRPSQQQMDFIRSFGEYIAKPIVLQPRNDDEERYQTVLAEVLSLSAKGRERLLRDLEKLT